MAGHTTFLVFSAAAAVLTVITFVPTTEAVPAVFVFGDSTVDVGNNNFLPGDSAKANHPFYGVDYPGGVPTGRFSNGYNGADFLAKMIGFRKSPPPVLSIKNKQEVFRGVSFASGGSGILDATGQNVSLSMNTQIKYFEKVVEFLNKSMGHERAAYFLSKSIFIFSTANNDMFGFYQVFGPQNSTMKDQFVSTLAFDFRVQLQKIYKLGARKFAVIGTALIGCVPALRLTNANGDCAEDLNDLSRRQNNATAALLHDLSLKLEGMKYSHANSYKLFSDVLSSHVQYGYKTVDSACCGGGRLNAVDECTANATLCSNRTEFVFWDSVHPTQVTYKLVAEQAYEGSPLFASPINVRELVRS